jgi:hypothetical protein
LGSYCNSDVFNARSFCFEAKPKELLKKKGDSLPSAQNDKIAQDSTDLTAILGLIKINKGD